MHDQEQPATVRVILAWICSLGCLAYAAAMWSFP